jgi:hypothetical protein
VAAAWARWKWSRRLAIPARVRLGNVSLTIVVAGGGVALSLVIGWLMLQREYFRAMPPDRY